MSACCAKAHRQKETHIPPADRLRLVQTRASSRDDGELNRGRFDNSPPRETRHASRRFLVAAPDVQLWDLCLSLPVAPLVSISSEQPVTALEPLEPFDCR